MEGEDEEKSSDDRAFWQQKAMAENSGNRSRSNHEPDSGIFDYAGNCVLQTGCQQHTDQLILTRPRSAASSCSWEMKSSRSTIIKFIQQTTSSMPFWTSEPIRYRLPFAGTGEVITLEDVPFAYEEVEGQTIVQLDFKVAGKEKTPLLVLKESWYMTTGVVKEVWVSFGKLITGQFQMNQLAGPVGVTQMIGEVASTRDYSSIFLMTAFITINIGVFNLLPLPALDGGRLMFLLLELLRGKPVQAKYEGYVHAAGLFLLMGLMLFVTFNDIIRLIKG